MMGMDSTNVYAYISIIFLLVCIPPALFIEGPKLIQHGFADAIAKVGLQKLLSDLFWIGMFYHLYNQVVVNTLEGVAPLTHAVGNVLKLTRYKSFKEGHKRLLDATDLVGRGIDIERVNIVFNYDMPDSADTYLHRVGRAVRFGTKGLAITFVSSATDYDVLNHVSDDFIVDIWPNLNERLNVLWS